MTLIVAKKQHKSHNRPYEHEEGTSCKEGGGGEDQGQGKAAPDDGAAVQGAHL